MLGSRLAHRIVLPVLILIGALFALLAFGALRIAEAEVEGELETVADRVAATLDELPVAPEHRPEILPALARLVRAEIVVDGSSSQAGWSAAETSGLEAGRARLGGSEYRVLERRSRRGPAHYFILTAAARIAKRRSDVLWPIVWTGAIGLLVAGLMGLIVARTIARPVKDLARKARRFAEGADPGIGPREPGEIGELQEAFQRMFTAIREGETKLRESERFATLGRLAGGIAHELRNPLTAIRMAVETATASEENAGARAIAVTEIERLDRTLREMLDYVRPREPQLARVRVAPLLAEVAALLGPQCEHLQVRLEIDAPEDLCVRADEDRLKQALLNLVLNAAQAQPHGGAVRVTAGRDGIEVADDGPGIPDEVRESLLQPFVTTKEAGIGLGLAVVKQVADEHGVELDFRTAPDGAAFTLRFPPWQES